MMFVKQYAKNDCVPTQFINVLKFFYKDKLPEKAIEAIYRQSFDISDGTSIYAMAHIAQLLNYYTDLHFECYTSEFETNLKDTLTHEGIVLVIRNFSTKTHVVIATGLKSNIVNVFDSATKLDLQSYEISKLLSKTKMLICIRSENFVQRSN